MRRSTIANAKNQFSRLLDAVRAGESILILDRPVARLEPVTDAHAGALPDALSRLERAGLLRRATAAIPRDMLAAADDSVPGPDDALLHALLDDRREGFAVEAT